jgi:hypothetical protein
MQVQKYTEEDLNIFDKLTMMESSQNQIDRIMDRIKARLEWKTWVEEHKWNKATLDAMKEELVKQGKW